MTAWCATAALLLGLIYAPLFHLHSPDHHEADAVVHAHFEELRSQPHEGEAEFEPDHSGGQARSIDLLTVDTSAPVVYALVGWNQALSEPVLPVQFAAASQETPRAHGPPETGPSSPRSPPLL